MQQSHQLYLKIMRGLRIVLPLVLAFILCVIFFWPMISEQWENRKDTTTQKTKLDIANITDNRLKSPSYNAVDEKGNPYSVNANWANQLDKNTVELDSPQGKITLDNEETISVKGESGLYHHDERQLHISGPVTLDSDHDQHLEGHNVKVDLKTKTMTTDDKVEGMIMGGKVSAKKGMHIQSSEGKKTITLKGRSHVTLNPQQIEKAQNK